MNRKGTGIGIHGFGKLIVQGAARIGEESVLENDKVIAPSLEGGDQEYTVVLKRKAQYRKPAFA
ncbi:hypothetical protein RAC89_06970 [Paenibacillus sp. GD4]|jgi:hypothetical protein|uniref:hypothetical protein n=1 Tax=Paenibacillus TaxID=44249 RepID=UPI002543202F|nr:MULTISPECIES: hypothetical protein [Paenibacillus]MDQ1910239.1 hypothetical protein [Paenibacillus sp. GD4]